MEQDITIDGDEVEQEIEFDFKLPVNAELESTIVPVLKYNDKILKARTGSQPEIFVGTGSIK